MRNQLETEQTPNEWDYWMCQVWENKECWYKINRMIQANHLEINCGSLKQNGVVLDKITGNN